MAEATAFLADASATRIAALIRNRDVSSVQVTEACLARVEALSSTYRVYVTVLKDQALQAAEQADAEVRRQGNLGPLHGVPMNVKDAFLVRGTATTVGSTLLRGYPPDRNEEATCVQRLRQAGAIILGKVNVGSGMAANPDGTRLDPPLNPWRPSCTPGGSSSGSSVAVALGMGYASVGTDLGGSIRIPAAFTGVVGLKPTFGRVSQYGDVFGLCQTLEHVGPLTRTVRDAALMLSILAGHDPRDPTSVDRDVPDFVARLEQGPANGLRIGWASDGGPQGADPEVMARVEAAVRLLAGAGVSIEEMRLPSFGEEWWYQFTLLDEWDAYDAKSAEPAAYFAFIKARLHGKRRKVLDQLNAQAARVREAYRNLFEQFDLLVLPTAPITAKPFDVRTLPWKGREIETFDLHLMNTWMFNLTGHPAISLPCGFDSNGLPVGLQIVGRHFEEDTLLRVGAAYERAAGGFPMPQIFEG